MFQTFISGRYQEYLNVVIQMRRSFHPRGAGGSAFMAMGALAEPGRTRGPHFQDMILGPVLDYVLEQMV